MEKNNLRNYRINSPSVIYQDMDNEIVIIDLESGIYYSIEGFGITLWKMIDCHYSVNQILSLITEIFHGDSLKIRKEILIFVEILNTEGLISIVEDDVHSDLSLDETIIKDLAIDKQTKWRELKLNRFTDMQDLLLLDPIHDANVEGWPNSAIEQK